MPFDFRWRSDGHSTAYLVTTNLAFPSLTRTPCGLLVEGVSDDVAPYIRCIA
jgi:hypothetical protein